VTTRPQPLDVLRVVLAFTQAAMVCTTWSLWSARDVPANLPVVEAMPSLPVGWLLLASCVLVVVRPREGIVVNAVVLLVAVALDQLRLQPEFASVAVLLVATGPWRLSRTLGWGALASLWLWAGIGKLLSAGFQPIADLATDRLGVSGLAGPALWAIPLGEIALGIGALIPRTRRWAGWCGAALHLVAPFALDLGPSSAIFWWNTGLAAAAIVLLALDAPQPERRPAPSPALAKGLLVVLFAYPALAYAGTIDPYLGHHLYSGDVPTAVVCRDGTGCSDFGVLATRGALGVPIPPTARMFERWFLAGCTPGEVLEVQGMRLRAPLDSLPVTRTTTVTCPAPT
jgi:hypothetical protein